ncbi:MAG: porin [Bacteroidales bacterium]|nr:OprO/OprP family phosphate-selective porin [Bacteroidales bacterium]MDY4521897.1 porin [Bacteroidales bacterium]
MRNLMMSALLLSCAALSEAQEIASDSTAISNSNSRTAETSQTSVTPNSEANKGTNIGMNLGSNFTVNVHGTVRGKFEWQPDADAARFEVRNARFSLSGNITPMVTYKAEIDLCDEGSMKMLDAYGRVTGKRSGVSVTIGQMRVPFTIDAHRSPHEQFFANRSFLAKQVGNVRDVGAAIKWDKPFGAPLTLEGGIFNGSGLTNQKNFWTDDFNCSAKAKVKMGKSLTATASYQKTHPGPEDIRMFGAGVTFDNSRWQAEAEYLRKNYDHDSYDGVNTFDIFACYNQPVRRMFQKISYLVRWDFMSNHSNGTASVDTDGDGVNDALTTNDPQRNRITGGATFSFGAPFRADIRLNYEHYFYKANVTPAVSEQSKLVVELMVRF